MKLYRITMTGTTPGLSALVIADDVTTARVLAVQAFKRRGSIEGGELDVETLCTDTAQEWCGDVSELILWAATTAAEPHI